MGDMPVSTPSPEQLLTIAPEESERVAATVARFLTPSLVPLFSARFTRSHFLFDEFVFRLALRVFVEMQLAEAVSEWGTVDEVVARRGLEPRRSVVPMDWMLRHDLVDRAPRAHRLSKPHLHADTQRQPEDKLVEQEVGVGGPCGEERH